LRKPEESLESIGEILLLAVLLVMVLYNNGIRTRTILVKGDCMNNSKNNIPLGDGLLSGISGGLGGGSDCGLEERDFPKPGKCFQISSSIAGAVFNEACPYCNIWTSLPEGVNLQVSHIFECNLYGHVKRIKED
jgi:hypothetical protein